ncbi:TPA: glycosyltransferase family 4 protein, partial [Enterobacter hormaechei]|nr:glycosyltransferase family 4 protein [Enterobacter hormaechei]
ENTFNFLFIGRVQFDKGIVELLDAFVKIPKDNITLNVVGEGKLLKHLKEKYKDVKNIFFWGSLSNNKIPVAILNSHVIVVPSNNKYEGFPRVILESWLFGKPVIVSNVGGINALVKDRSNGLIYDNHNEGELACKLYEITDKDLYSQLSEGALKMRDVSLADYWKNVLLSIMNSFNK